MNRFALLLLSLLMAATTQAQVEAISLLGRPLQRPDLDPARQQLFADRLSAARAQLKADPDDVDAEIWVGRRLAYLGRYRDAIEHYSQAIQSHSEDPRLYRHRGHRFITVRRFDLAIADLERASTLIEGRDDRIEPDGLPNDRGIPTSTLNGNIYYHLGLAYYLSGRFRQAHDAWQRSLATVTNPDMEVAARYWLVLSAARGGLGGIEQILAPVRADWDIIENDSYHRLLLLYRGDIEATELSTSGADPLQNATLAYGLAMARFMAGDSEAWRAAAAAMLAAGSWAAFGHIAAEADLARGRQRPRDLGIVVGVLLSGPDNAITDVPGVRVGHYSLLQGSDVRTGVTAVLPHGGNLFQSKVPAAGHVFNAFGKTAGLEQLRELGELETPIVLTNTLSVGAALSATVRWTLDQPGNEAVRSVNAVVGETNDGFLNDIRGQYIRAEHVTWAIESAGAGPVTEGSVGAGVGTRAFGYKGGIGTASRVAELEESEPFTVGVMVQANFGWILKMLGMPVGRVLMQPDQIAAEMAQGDGSCMIVIATDAPLEVRNLERMARRAFAGMGRTRAVMTNGSGDYAIAFSTAYRLPHGAASNRLPALVGNNAINPLFQAVEEATEEAIYNALFAATEVSGRDGHRAEALPRERVLAILRQAGLLDLDQRLPHSPHGG